MSLSVDLEAIPETSPSTAVLAEAPKEGRRERRARETRRKILHAALELFAERGMEAVTVEEIGDRADVARGTVFNYFATKESLCQGIGELQVELLQDAALDGRIWGPTAGEKIEQALRLLAELPGYNPVNCRALLTRALACLQPGEMPEHRRQLFALFQAWVVEGQQSGEIRKDVESCELAGFIMGLQFQATLTWSYGFVGGSLADHQARVLRFALDGIRAR